MAQLDLSLFHFFSRAKYPYFFSDYWRYVDRPNFRTVIDLLYISIVGTCNNIETLRDPGYGTKLFFLIIVYSFSLPMHFSKNHLFALCCILYIINVILETLPFVYKWSSFGFPRYAETINFYSHFWSTFILNRIPMLYELSNANFSFLSFFFLSFSLFN